MGPGNRLDFFIEKHIGFGIRWNNFPFALTISISILCFTINIGFGKSYIE
ncbi:MAG: hypothetical protein M0R17_03925 [Candidatus Omnitrophica bacterium]|jgi:hypothetical protein|nr:hypothetical protein [Candidatus Omnitrophota bacterium]